MKLRLLLLALLAVAGLGLSGCVVYDRGYYHDHDYGYRHDRDYGRGHDYGGGRNYDWDHRR